MSDCEISAPAPLGNVQALLSGMAAAFTFVVIALVKAPNLLLHPRFWAEEGAYFYQDLQHASLWVAVTYVYGGSLLFLTSISVWLSTLVPPVFAPYITTYIAFAFQVSVAALMGIWAHINRLHIIVTFLLAASWALIPTSYEIWATSTNIQWSASIAMLLVLLLPGANIGTSPRLARLGTLICGLSGIPACMLAPAFLLVGIRSRQHLCLGLILLACAMLQGAVLVTHPAADRHLEVDAAVAALVLAKGAFTSLLGVGLGSKVIGLAPADISLTAMVVCGSAAFAGATYMAYRVDRISAICLAGMGVLVTGLNSVGALGNPWAMLDLIAGLRYSLFASIVFCLMLALGSRTCRPLAWCLGLICLVGACDRVANPNYRFFLQGPDWRTEVAACHSDRPCEAHIWPVDRGRPVWRVRFTPASKSAG